MKIMFDSNIFDKLPTFIDQIKSSTTIYEYYITTIQVEELCDIPDIEKRKTNILMLADLRAKLIPNSVCVLGHSRLGYSRLGEGDVYNLIINENKSNIKDAIIADTAVKEGCTLITEDKRFYNKMKSNGFAVLKFDDFLSEF